MNAFTTSSCPSIAAEKIVGFAPFASRKSAIGLLPTCDAASMHVSQSPKPQSIEARASAGWRSTSSCTRLRSRCETPTTSLTSAGSFAGNTSLARDGEEGGACPQAFVAKTEMPSADKPAVNLTNERRDHRCAMNPTSGVFIAERDASGKEGLSQARFSRSGTFAATYDPSTDD